MADKNKDQSPATPGVSGANKLRPEYVKNGIHDAGGLRPGTGASQGDTGNTGGDTDSGQTSGDTD